jgi:hypothetical protein
VKKSSKDEKNSYLGVCGECGELYEANSLVDDLEGLTFNCKKMLCSGRVELAPAAKFAISEAKALPVDESSLEGSNPRRFC